MQDYGAMIRSTFELGSVRDAELLFETIVKNAFPTFTFRRLEIRKGELDSFPVWEVNCHRVTMGKTPDKQVYLDYLTLDFIRYREA